MFGINSYVATFLNPVTRKKTAPDEKSISDFLLWKKQSSPSPFNGSGKVRRCLQATLFAGKSKNRGGGRQELKTRVTTTYSDKRFVCLQDQNKHVHAQTTTTSQSAKVQDTGTQYTTTEEGVKPLRFQNTMWVKTKLSSSANVKRINRRRPSLHAHNLFSSAKKEAVLMSLNRKIKWKDIQKQVWEIQTPPFLFKQLQFSLKVGIMTVGERAVVQPRALSSRLKKTTTGTLVVRNWQFGTLHRS